MVKDIEDVDLPVIFGNLRKYGWSVEQIEELQRKGSTSREGKLSDGMLIVETLQIKDKFQIIGG